MGQVARADSTELASTRRSVSNRDSGNHPCWSHNASMKKPSLTKLRHPPRPPREIPGDNDKRIRERAVRFLRIPSVSARSEHNGDTQRAAAWLKSSLDKIGVPATSTRPRPSCGIGRVEKAPGAPTVIVYGHYDVSPSAARAVDVAGRSSRR